jgi:hypothetical protein
VSVVSVVSVVLGGWWFWQYGEDLKKLEFDASSKESEELKIGEIWVLGFLEVNPKP